MNMDTTHEETLGDPPSVVTVEFFNPDGKRYNFEQLNIDAGSFIETVNESGDKLVFRFWKNRQPDSNYPVDKAASERYEKEVLGKNKL